MEKNNQTNLNNLINFLLKYGTIFISTLVAILGILSIFITAYFNSTFYHAEEKTYFKYNLGIIEISLTIFTFILIFFLIKTVFKKISSSILLILICIFSLALYIYWINALRLNPESDQKLIHEMAISFLNGNIDYYLKNSQYLFLYPYQFPFTLLVSAIYKLFGENFLYVQYINAICSVSNIVLLFYISKILFKNEGVQKILALLLGAFSLYWMFFNVHFYANIIGLFLALISTLFTLLYLEKKTKIYLIFSGSFISLSILIKTNYSIFLCGITIILILDILFHLDSTKSIIYKFKTIITIISSFIISYFFIIFAYNRIG